MCFERITLWMLSLSLLVFRPFIMAVQTAEADITWLDEVISCEDISRGMSRFFSSVTDVEQLTVEQQEELDAILKVVCGPRFARCNVSICKKVGTVDASGSSSLKRAELGNPLAWVNQYMSCADLTQQIRSRYGPLGKYSTLPEVTRRELKYVLDVACSARFAHCRFRSCARMKASGRTAAKRDVLPDKEEAVPSQVLVLSSERQAGEKVAEDLTAKKEDTLETAEGDAEESSGKQTHSARYVQLVAELELQHLVERLALERKKMIDRAVAEEKKNKSQWHRLGNPYELKIITARERAIKERKEERDTSASSGTGSYDYGSSQRRSRSTSSSSTYRRRRPRKQPKPATSNPLSSDGDLKVRSF